MESYDTDSDKMVETYFLFIRCNMRHCGVMRKCKAMRRNTRELRAANNVSLDLASTEWMKYT